MDVALWRKVLSDLVRDLLIGQSVDPRSDERL